MLKVSTAPMGWNSWNTFGDKVCEKVIMETADAMVERGFKDAGYEYIVIDDTWSLKSRDENGQLVADPVKFPNGIKYLADYVHSKGLKLGIYSCTGYKTCGGYPGSYGNEFTDAKTFASWDIDFLKYDNCYFPEHKDNKYAYLTMANALRTCGKDIVFSACNWGRDMSWKWMREVGAHMYRSTADIFNNFHSIKNIIDEQYDKFNLSGFGSFNDLDMLVCGMTGDGYVECEGLIDEEKAKNLLICNSTEHRLHFGFWAMFSAPLMLGCDIRKVREEYVKLMTNPLLIKINQDQDARPPMEFKTTYFYHDAKNFVKLLADGSYAVGLFNFNNKEISVSINADQLGFPRYSNIKLNYTDAFTGENLGIFENDFDIVVPIHDCKIYIVNTK